ncbi:hypothetical protein [Celeribacter litoreus]|uniref:hypothetical protein n=1 Tax=Celeribacter litoreus TaxID=2876714 RepID=UPI001CCC0FAA|nr:hypothetical protein [Celeribacter litoreus]MCA0043748.1 hypothetical protein [Celeribacter litoreus]
MTGPKNEGSGNVVLGVVVGALIVIVAGFSAYALAGGDIPGLTDEPEIQIDLPGN